MSNINLSVLRAIANATAANSSHYVSQAEGLPLVQHSPPLIVVDASQTDPSDASKIAARVTADGAKYLAAQGQDTAHTKPIASYEVGSGLVLPKVQRGFGPGGGGGAPSKYPFDKLEIGQYFFVPNSDVNKGDAVKTMSSAVGAANQRYSEETGETKTVNRTKRGEDNKAVKGEDGKNIKETVQLPVKRATRKFAIRRVEAGKNYGTAEAPIVFNADGAVIARVALDA